MTNAPASLGEGRGEPLSMRNGLSSGRLGEQALSLQQRSLPGPFVPTKCEACLGTESHRLALPETAQD